MCYGMRYEIIQVTAGINSQRLRKGVFNSFAEARKKVVDYLLEELPKGGHYTYDCVNIDTFNVFSIDYRKAAMKYNKNYLILDSTITIREVDENAKFRFPTSDGRSKIGSVREQHADCVYTIDSEY